MKKILNEWRKFINETKPKHPPRPSDPNRKFHDRTRTAHRQAATEGPLELVRISMTQYMVPVSSYDVGHGENFKGAIHSISKLQQQDMEKFSNHLRVLQYIYSRRPHEMINLGDQSVVVSDFKNRFNDRRAFGVRQKIDDIMKELNISPLSVAPSEAEVEDVFKFYVMPNNYSSIYSEPTKPTNRFNTQLSFSPEKLASINRLYFKNRGADD